ncbi:MAG: PhoPQ-activated protein PqaA family protein [Phycisphaeraceae bacterium]
MRSSSALAFAFSALLALPPNLRADLKSYVEKEDKSYKVTIDANHDIGETKVITARLTSQTWRGIEWSHWLSIIVPPNIKHKDKAILFITGGKNTDGAPKLDSTTAKMFLALAQQTGSVMAVIQQVPNQPLFEGRNEDALIAMTFAKYIETQEEDWPLLLPMVKSATRAMDAVQTICKERLEMNIDGFVVTGASKRGWTTWLTAAIDKRVIAIAPMVIDVLNFDAQLAHQRMSYGRLSEKIGDYDELKLPEKMKTENGKKLNALVDPYNYIDAIKVPKLILLGTNDAYWTVDASSHYFPQLKGSKYLYYEPNAGHGLGLGILPTMVAFFDASMSGKPLPELKWSIRESGGLEVKWKGKHKEAILWEATSETRDFRKAVWRRTPITTIGDITFYPRPVGKGWAAGYVEVRFPAASGLTFSLCTQMTVLPKAMPFDGEGKPVK